MPDEGYIKFNCHWKRSGLPAGFNPAELLQTRDKVFEMGLIGFDEKERVGFGNISQRYKKNQFVISGTQTGHLKNLSVENLSVVENFSLEENSISCSGPAKASSESLTHAAIYSTLPYVAWVIHVHSAQMWDYFLDKGPATAPEVAYGTPEMAAAVIRLINMEQLAKERFFVMAGHRDGLISFGISANEALAVLDTRSFQASRNIQP
jgi:L-ribulose-5-phosphate 4-epimerase